MKLFYNPPSPYARKVLALAHELNLMDQLILIPVDPWKDPPELLDATPLAKVPALLTDDGVTLTESTAICEDAPRLAGAPTPDGDAWLDLASRTGLAQGLIDASFGIVVESRRPPKAQSSGWRERLQRAEWTARSKSCGRPPTSSTPATSRSPAPSPTSISAWPK